MSLKKLSPKELIAERNPLIRPVVAPVDIYDQINEEEKSREELAKAEKSAVVKSKPLKQKPSQKRISKKITDTNIDPVGPYSTYLRRSQVKRIKHYAIDRDLKDQDIVQLAIDEYFTRHAE